MPWRSFLLAIGSFSAMSKERFSNPDPVGLSYVFGLLPFIRKKKEMCKLCVLLTLSKAVVVASLVPIKFSSLISTIYIKLDCCDIIVNSPSS